MRRSPISCAHCQQGISIGTRTWVDSQGSTYCPTGQPGRWRHEPPLAEPPLSASLAQLARDMAAATDGLTMEEAVQQLHDALTSLNRHAQPTINEGGRGANGQPDPGRPHFQPHFSPREAGVSRAGVRARYWLARMAGEDLELRSPEVAGDPRVRAIVESWQDVAALYDGLTR